MRYDLASNRKKYISFSGSPSSKLTLSILTDQLVCFGVISLDNMSSEDLVGSNFPFLLGNPPLPYLLDIKVGRGGGEVVKATKREEGAGVNYNKAPDSR